MKTSVLIIAHNEEDHIEQCIRSVLNQTQLSDEIVVICHNCTDRTEIIARMFQSARVIPYNGPDGAPYARIKGFQEVAGDIVACLDGDSVAHTNWLRSITKPLLEHTAVTLVAGYVILQNGLFGRLTSFWQFVILKKIIHLKLNCFAWGSNFACRKTDYEKVGGIAPIIELKEKLPLNFWAEDFYISLALMQIGEVYFALGAKTYTRLPQWKVDLATAPTRKWMEDNRALLTYFKKN